MQTFAVEADGNVTIGEIQVGNSTTFLSVRPVVIEIFYLKQQMLTSWWH